LAKQGKSWKNLEQLNAKWVSDPWPVFDSPKFLCPNSSTRSKLIHLIGNWEIGMGIQVAKASQPSEMHFIFPGHPIPSHPMQSIPIESRPGQFWFYRVLFSIEVKLENSQPHKAPLQRVFPTCLEVEQLRTGGQGIRIVVRIAVRISASA